ncbi:hypothetical protein V6N13_104630 [Hibiscus sabdariffa]
MRVGDQTMTINVFNTNRYMDDDDGCHYLQDSIATVAVEDTELCYNSSIQIDDFVHLQEDDREELDDLPFKEQQIKHSIPRYGMKFESLDFTKFVPPKSSLEIAPALELKPLPSHLKYVYLGAKDTGSCDIVLKISYFKCKYTLLSSYSIKDIDDKGVASAEATGPAWADISAGLQNSAERRAVLLAYP